MQGEMVIYNGRAVSRKNFRAFIFSVNGERKLVNSYDEFEDHIGTGIWFPSKESVEQVKSKKKKKGDE
jgi:hypothetical protein